MSWKDGQAATVLTIALALVTLAHTAESRRPDTAQATDIQATGPAAHAPRLHAVPPSPFIHGTARGSVAPAEAAASGPASRLIRFANGLTVDTRTAVPSGDASRALDAGPRAGGTAAPRYYLVQFDGPILAEWRAGLEGTGAAVLGYMPDHAYVIRMRPDRLADVASLPHVVWTGDVTAAMKVAPAAQFEAARRAIRDARLAVADDRDQVVIIVWSGESMDAVAAAIASAGGRVLEASAPTNPIMLLRADVPRDAVGALAAEPAIAWIEPWEPMRISNDRCQWVMQTFVSADRKVWTNGITGAGQVMNSVDSGVNPAHNAFKDAGIPITTFGDYPTHRKVIAYKKTYETAEIAFGDHAIATYHGTHTGGTLMGNDAPFAADQRDGMAKDAKLYFLDAGGTASDGIIVPNDLYSMYLMPYNGNGGGAARISSNSWGSPVAGAYTGNALQVDQFMWDHQDFLFFFSNGNNGGVGLVGSPATAKNCVSAGGTGNGTSATQLYTATSRGPTVDGRRKPTVCAPASVSSADGASTASYRSLSGTSMACPALAGSILLARQYLVEGRYPTGTAVPAHAFIPSGALLKAMAVNSGQNDITSFTVPDNNVGWGRVKLDDVLYFSGDARNTVLVDEGDGLITGEYVEYEVHVSDSSQPLRVSLVWTDYPPNTAAAVMLVNDLDLTVTNGATTYLGNVFSGGQSVTGGSADSLNVEECVWRTSPATGTWRIRVTATNVPSGPQPFALVVSGGLGGSSGVVLLDQATYSPGDSVLIRVEDANAIPPVNVSLSSTTETAPETVTLTALGTGVYQRKFALGMLGEATGDGKLTVGQGDLITAQYSDPSPAHTAQATATVVANGPVITGVSALAVVSTRATIGWTNSVLATARVYYGTTPSLGSASALHANEVLAPVVQLDGLTPGTTYWYDVESADHYGNVVRDDNGGNHYTFTTRDRGDVLLVLGDDTFTAEDTYRKAFTRSGWTWDEWTEPLALAPPVGDLAGGLRSYPAVWWQVGWQQYPPLSDAARDSITRYNAGGGRLSLVSHDVAYAFGDSATSPDWTAAREAWLESQLHVRWQIDPSTIGQIKGITADPISGSYTALIPYSPPFSGGAGDEIDLVNGTGTANYIWRDNRFVPDDVAVRWVNGAPGGDPDSALWGGTATRNVTQCFEWSRLNVSIADDTTRAGILDKTLLWLVGRDHPTIQVTSPAGGEVFTSSPVSIGWTETFDGAAAASRRIDYSNDGGQSWIPVTSSPGASPYSWDISSLPNAATYLVRVTVRDDGAPGLAGLDTSDAVFTVNRPGGDTRGPVVVAGTAITSPNPVTAPGTFLLFATIDDARTGNSNVTAAEWSFGITPAAAGSGTPMTGSFTSPTVAVLDTVDAATMPDGYVPVWIRGRDAAGAWGTADSVTIVVNGGLATDVAWGGTPVFALAGNTPNPFNPVTTLRFSLASRGPASLVIYDVAGREVRRLVSGTQSAGPHEVRWDGRDDRGRSVSSGVYFARLEAAGDRATRKMVLMK